MRVRVHRIESIRDPEGNLGKRIELVEDNIAPRFAIRPSTEEARMIQETIKVIQQQIPVFTMQPQMNIPKIILFLTEHEYESLGIKFDVNQVYEVELSNKTIKFNAV